MPRNISKLIIGATVVVVSLVGVSYASWNAADTRSDRVRSGEAVELTIIASDGVPDLYPGFTAGDVHFHIENQNPYSVTFTEASARGVTSSDPADCPPGNMTVIGATGLSLHVGPYQTTEQLSIADIVTMAADAPNACQNVVFDIELTLTGTQD